MAAKKKTVSADSGNPFSTLVNLWPYMWPVGRADLKARVIWATVFLLLAKLVLISVPYFFKWATDALNGKLDMAVANSGSNNVTIRLGNGDGSFAAVLRRATIALAAVQLGVADGTMRLAASYTSERVQFGRPLGSF